MVRRPRTPATIAMFVITLLGGGAAVDGPRAQDRLIDFEDLDLGDREFAPVASPLVYRNVGGSGVTITASPGLRCYDLWQFGHDKSATGQALIDWFGDGNRGERGITISFDRPVKSVSLKAGDFHGDDDSPLTITAYDAAGKQIATTSADWKSGRGPPFATLSLAASGIRRVEYSSGGDNPHSTFIDDIRFTPDR